MKYRPLRKKPHSSQFALPIVYDASAVRQLSKICVQTLLCQSGANVQRQLKYAYLSFLYFREFGNERSELEGLFNKKEQVLVQASYTYYAKSFAYMNKLPRRYVNHDKKRMALVPPRQTPWHSTLGRRCSRKRSDPPFHRRGSRVLEGKYLFRSVQACTKPEKFPIPYLHFMNNNIQGRILYC